MVNIPTVKQVIVEVSHVEIKNKIVQNLSPNCAINHDSKR